MTATPTLTLWGVGTSRTIRPHWAMHELGADRLDFQDISALIAEKHGRERTRHHPRQVEDTNTAE